MWFMKEFSKFYFKSFDFDKQTLTAKFVYSFDNEIFFEEFIDFSCENFYWRIYLDEKIINNILFHIHLALWISYYKLFPTKDLIVETWFLDENQVNFWKKFYINWLWEFLYKNKISPKWLFNFVSKWENIYKKIDFTTSNKCLVPIWWGKDSLVSIELLKNSSLDFETVVFGKIDEIKQNCINLTSKENLLIKRKLSSNLFELNNQGYYNWHVPITWIIAFVLQLSAYIYDYKYIILSNEKSANFGNLFWEWFLINHQYSKSLDFEIDFNKYVNNYISSDLKYFSLLRWLYEIKIAELFTKLWKNYFSVFSSCNNNFKINSSWNSKNIIWCNNCPKCTFVYSILRHFISKEETLQIFWKELYEDENLLELFKELLWISGNKPFECVWEAEEVLYSMNKSLEIFKDKLPFILNILKDDILREISKINLSELEEKLFKVYDEYLIPKEIKEKIKFVKI